MNEWNELIDLSPFFSYLSVNILHNLLLKISNYLVGKKKKRGKKYKVFLLILKRKRKRNRAGKYVKEKKKFDIIFHN